MKLPWDARFAAEVLRFDLRYTCRDCVYFLPESQGCIHEWPLPRTLADHDAARPAAEVVFCKELELR